MIFHYLSLSGVTDVDFKQGNSTPEQKKTQHARSQYMYMYAIRFGIITCSLDFQISYQEFAKTIMNPCALYTDRNLFVIFGKLLRVQN